MASLIALAVLAGCHGDDNTLTGPDPTPDPNPTITPSAEGTRTPTTTHTQTATPVPTLIPSATPTPPPGSLNGSWTGAVHTSGRTDEFFCPPRTAPVTASISGSDDALRIELSSASGCSRAGATVFSGAMSDSSLSGSLTASVAGDHGCALTGFAHGSADAHQIHLEGSMRGTCNDVNVTVDLTR
jgi:hypothetical protein